MDGVVPGFVPRVLSDPTVGLFRADERVFGAMLDGWRAQMLARGLTTATIEGRCRLVRRFQEFTGEFPWQWRPVDIEEFLAERRSAGRSISLTTLRADSNAVGMFCAYLIHPAYGWPEFCERTFGDMPGQICFEWNTPRHTTDDAMPVGRRAFTKAELQRLFDYLDDLVDGEYAAGSKRWLPAQRDSIAFKVCYAYGLRRRELTMLDLHDFGPNPHVPDYGTFGAVTIRWAKGTAGSGPRRRTVLTVPEFELGRRHPPRLDCTRRARPVRSPQTARLHCGRASEPIASRSAASETPSLQRAMPPDYPKSLACTACVTPTSRI